jgi:hypothetical protein
MIAFGCSITDPRTYARCAEPGIGRAAEPDTVVLANAAAGSIFRSYNLLLEQAAALDGLEALVLIHQDAEIVDPDFCAKVREALADPDIGVVGCVGAIDVRSIAWWEGSVTFASFVHRYGEYGGGEVEAFSWAPRDGIPAYSRTGDVETLDGFVLALTPWVVRNIRFDESLGLLHGYDLDFCLQVREAGRKVRTADLKVVHHHSLELVGDAESWIAAHIRVAEKWDERMPGIGRPNVDLTPGDWRQRARRAEAEAGVARLEAQSARMQLEAAQRKAQREVGVMASSLSWRLTAPLRRLNSARLQRAPVRAPPTFHP